MRSFLFHRAYLKDSPISYAFLHLFLHFSARFSLFSLRLSVMPHYSQVCREDKVLSQVIQHGPVVCMNSLPQLEACFFTKAISFINLRLQKEDVDSLGHV